MGQNRVAKKNRQYNKKNKGKRIYTSKHIRKYENINNKLKCKNNILKKLTKVNK